MKFPTPNTYSIIQQNSFISYEIFLLATLLSLHLICKADLWKFLIEKKIPEITTSLRLILHNASKSQVTPKGRSLIFNYTTGCGIFSLILYRNSRRATDRDVMRIREVEKKREKIIVLHSIYLQVVAYLPV